MEPLGENILKRAAPGAVLHMQEAIAEAGGREVFFAGSLDAAGRVAQVRVCARGNDSAVPALFEVLDVREVVIHNHPTGELSPSEADLELASMFSAHGHGMYIIDNEAQRVYVVIEPFLPKQAEWLGTEELHKALGPKSRMAKALPQFEVRPQQLEMMDAVADAFNRDGIAVVEAPTGVGKTLAYLLPAALWAVRNKERIVISTRTINLQEQIVLKDIPLLQRCLKEPFTACLVKGRGNYVCLRKLERAAAEASLFDEEKTQEQVKALAEWVQKTEDGSLSDLPFVPERELWERVCSEADTCAMGACPNQKACFVTKARRAVARADLVVANHHMLFSDVSIKKETGDFTALAVLPSYRRVIFDEAHSIEESATEYFGVSATRTGALAALARFYRLDRGRERGLIPFIKVRLTKDCTRLSIQDYEALLKLMDEELLPAVAVCREALQTAFAILRSFTAERCGKIGRDIKWRLTEEILRDEKLREVHQVYMLPAVEDVRLLIRHCEKLLRGLKGIPSDADDTESPLQTEILQLNAYARRLENVANVLAECTSDALQENTVRWIEIDAKYEQSVRVARCPLHVGKPLADWVYENLKTVVMTSATLAVQQQFGYLSDRLGLNYADPGRIRHLILDSPFDFQEQALLGIPNDLPNPDDKSFLEQSVAFIGEVLQITGGHAFLLFTSFYTLDYAYKRLEGELRSRGSTPLRQGEATRTQLLDRFRSDTRSVLFATDSFWEGVDVAGEALQCVILPKLPFRVPTEPILEARAEAIESSGGNAFMAYYVPQAVIKFRQGFGRLIRRRTDRGVILVLDRRIATRYYGKAFLQSLPEIRMVKGPKAEVLADLTEFFTSDVVDTGTV